MSIKGRRKVLSQCDDCWWYGKPIDCPAEVNLDTYECKNFDPKENKRDWELNTNAESKRQRCILFLARLQRKK